MIHQASKQARASASRKQQARRNKEMLGRDFKIVFVLRLVLKKNV
jgi:hypothetical protein